MQHDSRAYPRMRSIAESRDFTKMPDYEGYFLYHQNAGCYIEIMSYDKALNDAKKRNRAFFEQLQIPMPCCITTKCVPGQVLAPFQP